MKTCDKCGGELIAIKHPIAVVYGREVQCPGQSCASCGEFWTVPGDIVKALAEAESATVDDLARKVLTGDMSVADAHSVLRTPGRPI